MQLNRYLKQIQLEQDVVQGDTLKCSICGRVVTIEEEGKGPLICCGKPMDRIGVTTEAGFEQMPKGWDKSSVKKFANTLAKNEAVQNAATKPGFFEKCVSKMQGKVANPEGFCAAIKDEAHGGDKASTYWRGKGKSEKEAKQKIASVRNKIKEEVLTNLDEDFEKGTKFSLAKQDDNRYKVRIITPTKVMTTVPMAHSAAKTFIYRNLMKQK